MSDPRDIGTASAGLNTAPAPACLYVGQVMHQRMKPVSHRFSYSVFSLMVDLDRLDEAAKLSALFSVNRFNLMAFYESDHCGLKDGSLRRHIDSLLSLAGIERAARIDLVCYPRILGWVFNPLSVYYAYDDKDRLSALVYEVRNTFGEKHTYVCPVVSGQVSKAGIRQSCDKIFHVSPFIPLSMRYHFRMVPPAGTVRWRILETDSEGPLLSATFAGDRVAMTSAAIVRLVARIPMLTLKIVGAIHWQALKLWLKGMKYIPKPPAPDPVSISTQPPIGEI
jgi:uncharacterized protein